MSSSLTKHESESFLKRIITYKIPVLANQPNEHVFGLVENQHRHRKNSPVPHRKTLRTRLNPSWCEEETVQKLNDMNFVIHLVLQDNYKDIHCCG